METNIYEEMYKRHKAGQTFVLVTIIKTRGASPRKAGAKMLVFPDGKIFGTVGGGNFENLVINDCLSLLESTAGHLLKLYTFAKAGEGATGMTCGGEAEVFMEVNEKPKKLIVFGGGHVGRELVRIARASDFLISVIDDRPDILSEYDGSIKVIQTDEEYQENFPTFDRDTYVVIVTRSHKIDRSILERVISQQCAYIGLIGSRPKIVKMFNLLKESGVDAERLEKVYAPIGLDIKGDGPFEIAISIMAELIAVKHGITRSQ